MRVVLEPVGRGSVRLLLTLKNSGIITIVMAVVWGTIGAASFAGAIALYIFGACVLAIILVLISVYCFIESGRWAYWRDVHYHGSDDTSSKPPPQLLFMKLLTNVKERIQSLVSDIKNKTE